MSCSGKTMLTNQHGFTLIELVVVLVVIGILSSIAIPRYFDIRQNTADMTNLANSRAIEAAIILYYTNHLTSNPGYQLSDAITAYQASPADFFYNGQVPKTADKGDFTVSLVGDNIIVSY